MPYFLALDAGGTKTDALLADAHRILARGSADTIKLLRTTPEVAQEARLTALLQELSAKSRRSASARSRGLVWALRDYSTGDLVSRWSQQASIQAGERRYSFSAEMKRSRWTRSFREHRGSSLLRARGQMRSAAAATGRCTARADGGRCWAMRAAATGSVWRPSARLSGHKTAM